MPLLGPDITTQEERNLKSAGIPSTRLESIYSSAKISSMGTPVEYLKNMWEDYDDPGEDMVSPEILNQQYPNLDIPFSEPVSSSLAKLLAERRMEKARYGQMIQSGPQDGLQTVMNFVASMVPHAVDPINIAASMAGGWAAYASLPLKSFVGKVAVSFAGGVAGNLPVEPLMMYGTAQEQEDYTANMFLMNVFGGALIGSGLHLVGSAAKGLRLLSAKGELPPKIQEAVARVALGKKVDIETKPITTSPLTNLRNFEVQKNLKAGDTRYFAANRTITAQKFKPRTTIPFDFFGKNTVFSSNAESQLTNLFSNPAGKGSLYYVDMPAKSKIFNMNNMEMPKALLDGLEGLKKGEDLPALIKRTPLKDLPELEEKIVDILTKEGYEGLNFKDGDNASLVVFDEAVVSKEAKQLGVDSDSYKNKAAEQVKYKGTIDKLDSPTSDRYYSDRVEKVIADTPAEIVVEVDVKKMVDGLEKRYNYGKETVEVKKIQSLKEDIDLKKKMISAAKDCVAKATT